MEPETPLPMHPPPARVLPKKTPPRFEDADAMDVDTPGKTEYLLIILSFRVSGGIFGSFRVPLPHLSVWGSLRVSDRLHGVSEGLLGSLRVPQR